MTLLIKNGGLTRLDLMFSMSLWKESQLLQILNNPSIKYLLKLKWCKTFKIEEKSCKGQFVICLKCQILIIDTWNECIKESNRMVNLFFYHKFNVNILQYLLLYLVPFQKKLTWVDITLTDTDTQHTQGPVDLHTHNIYICIYVSHP